MNGNTLFPDMERQRLKQTIVTIASTVRNFIKIFSEIITHITPEIPWSAASDSFRKVLIKFSNNFSQFFFDQFFMEPPMHFLKHSQRDSFRESFWDSLNNFLHRFYTFLQKFLKFSIPNFSKSSMGCSEFPEKKFFKKSSRNRSFSEGQPKLS